MLTSPSPQANTVASPVTSRALGLSPLLASAGRTWDTTGLKARAATAVGSSLRTHNGPVDLTLVRTSTTASEGTRADISHLPPRRLLAPIYDFVSLQPPLSLRRLRYATSHGIKRYMI